LEHFAPDQFLVVRLEDYEGDPRAYMGAVFRFLGLGEPEDWTEVLRKVHFNSHKVPRDPILPQTEDLLRDFFRPYNALLSRALGDDKFLWAAAEGEHPVRASMLHEDSHGGGAPRHGKKRHSRHPVEGAEEEDVAALAGALKALAGIVPEDQGQDSEGGDKEGEHDGAPVDYDAAGKAREEGRAQHDADQAERERFLHQKWYKLRNKADGADSVAEGQRSAGEDSAAAGFLRKRSVLRAGNVAGADKEGSSKAREDAPPAELSLVLTPRSFLLTGLPLPEEALTEDAARELSMDLSSRESAAVHLCGAAFTLDLALLQYLLYDVGVPADVTMAMEGARTALHCLPLLFTLADASSKSHVFALLKGKPSWLNKHFDPPMEVSQASVLSRDITSRLERHMLHVAHWLVAAGCPVNAGDVSGATALQFAAMGGELGLARLLLDAGADPNARNRDRRSPLHYAVALGHTELAGLLIERGGNAHLEDRHGMRPMDIIGSPGPILPEDALRYLNVTQRPAKQIERIIHPELQPDDAQRGWVGGTGGWSTARLAGYETNMSCSGVDQYWADEVTEELIFEQYIARNTPVLIRGLLSQWRVSLVLM
jgi:hypothetical protein